MQSNLIDYIKTILNSYEPLLSQNELKVIEGLYQKSQKKNLEYCC